jgi:ATP-binding cassette, subfamily B, bacterial PglK
LIAQLRKMLELLDGRGRIQMGGLFLLMLVAGGLEMASIGMVLPLFQVVIEPARVTTMPVVSDLYRWLAVTDAATFVMGFATALFVFFAVKNAFLAMLTHVQNRYLMAKQASFQSSLLDRYLRRPYAFHLSRNSAELIRNITQSVPLVFMRGLLAVLSIALEAILSIGALAVVFRVEPTGTLLTGLVLGGAGMLFHRVMRGRYHCWGRETEILTADNIQWINQGLGGVKEAKVLGCEDFFRARFEHGARRRGHFQALSSTFSQLPRMFIEVVAMGGLVLVIGVVLRRGENPQQLVPILGVFGIAAFRLMPSLNRILGHAANLKQGVAAVDAVHGDWQAGGGGPSPPPPRPLPENWRGLRVEGLCFTYPGADRPALDDVCLAVERGQSLAFVGGSGAGKTTLADVILGLIEPTAGRILLDGRTVEGGLALLRGHVGYVPQTVYLMDDSLRRNIAFGVPDEAVDETRLRRAVALAQLDDLVAGLPDGLHTTVGERGARLSGGQRQRIGIARALYNDPDILILDEATAALDNETERAIADAIRSVHGDKTVILIAHRLSTVRQCDAIHLLREGRIVASGPFDMLVAESAEFRRLVELGDLGIARAS